MPKEDAMVRPLILATQCMNTILSQIATLGVLLLALVSDASATSEYDYKPGEFLVIDGGKSPDEKYSIVLRRPR
jgi:hypothetical protein